MAIKHTFVSGKADGADTSLVRPSDWNADHTIENGSITNAMLAGSVALTKLSSDTTTALGVGTLELGHASDTTLSRSSAGVLAVEGAVVPTISSTNTLTNKSLQDSTTNFVDDGDSTKKMQFQLSGITSSTTRTMTVPNASGTLALGTGAANRIAYWSGTNTVTSNANLLFDGTDMTVGTTTADGRLYVYRSESASSVIRKTASVYSYLNGNYSTNYGVKCVAESDPSSQAIDPKTFGLHVVVNERTNGTNAGADSEAVGLYAKVTGTASNLRKYGAYIDTSNGGSTFTTALGTNYGILSTGGLNVFHSTTEQLRIAYDSSNYCSTTVGSTGTVTLDAVGSGAKFTFSDAVEVPDEAYGSGWDGKTQVPTKNAVYDRLETMKTQAFTIACSDETTTLAAGTGKVTFRMPYAFTVTAVRASLTTAQTSGNIFTVDVNESGTSILSTKLTIDNTEKTSTTAATPCVISDTALADDAEITIDIDQIGDSTAKGLKVTIIGYKA